jgi:molybdenum cofactor synthesis domain-containing protein
MTVLAEIREQPLDSLEVERAVAHVGAGAIVQFEGRVRDNNLGQPVTKLEYQAYSSMAEREMRRIIEAIAQRFAGTRLAVLHRVGTLAIGDIAIVCAVSAPHRSEAFSACRMLIDEVKARVPIWKREHGPDGPYWVGWQDARCNGDHEEPDTTRDSNDRGCQHHHQTASGALTGWRAVCITVSDTRSLESDESGSVVQALLEAAGAQVERRLVVDDTTRITAELTRAMTDPPQTIILSGGTGIGPRDVTVQAVEPLLQCHLEGFGEAFRRLSFDQIGTRALLSRALGGTIGATLVFALPGSPKAARLALEQLVIPLLPHARSMLAGHGH